MTRVPRSLVSQCVIGSACLMGLALGVLEPLHAAQREAMSQLEQAQSLSARAGELAALMPALTAEQARAAREIELIVERSAPARDTARLNAGIEAIAANSGVEVQRTQPREAAGPALTPPTHASADPAAPQPVRPDAVVGLTLDVAGTYGAVAAFVGALETDLGFTRVISLRMAPEGEHVDRVRATITTAHFAFSPPVAPTPAPTPATDTETDTAAPAFTEAKP